MVPRPLVATLLVAVAFAGCTGSSETADTKTPLPGIDVTVTDDTGAILGIVLDPAVRPVIDAQVDLIGPTGERNATTKSGEDGSFKFEGLADGTYILEVSHPLFRTAQVAVPVEAGEEPPVTKVELKSRFNAAPYVAKVFQEGYFDCSQNGAGVYSSSNCVTDQCPLVMDPATCNGLPTRQLDNVTQQEREWHMDVGKGWQGMVFEMQWEPSAQGTSPRMGMVVSTYKPLRDPTHSFANVMSASPMRFQLDVNTTHETAASVEPTQIPWEGMEDVSFFVSARRPEGAVCAVLCAPPGIALQQKFYVYIHQFYNQPVPEGWSFLAGDEPPGEP